MIHTLKCPSCSAPLDYDDGAGPTTVCPFCSNRIVVPDSLRRGAHGAFASTFSHAAAGGAGLPRRSASGVIVLVIGVILLVSVGVLLAAASFVSDATRRVAKTDTRPAPPRTTLVPDIPFTPPKESSDCVVLAGGDGEGIGPGQFKDARSVAVDGEGFVYSGDYTGGRIQVFDPAGKFVTQWMVDPRMPLRGMAADRRGTVYVVQSGKITRYEGKTGRALGKMEYAGGDGFDDVFVTAGGEVVAVYDRNTDDIVRFDTAGRVSKVIKKAISTQTESSELNMRLAVNGEGYIYALGTFNDAVLKFTPEGRFVTRFGGRGDAPGQFRALHSVAVDGRGRVYVSDFKGVQVFDADGRYVEAFNPAPVAFGLHFNDRDEMFVAARTKILKCAPRAP